MEYEFIVTDSGTKIIVLQENAETAAMMQALYSRSTKSVTERIKEIRDDRLNAESFMKKYYLNYGHKSIGDCGTCTVFIEGASILATKAFQNWPLYSGQESSTRYIDFSSQRIISPIEGLSEIQEEWRRWYTLALPELTEHLTQIYPTKTTGAIKSFAFDIMRGFLPAGTTTNFSWTMNLRQCADQIEHLRNHWIPEVVEITAALHKLLTHVFPASFGQKIYPKTEAYIRSIVADEVIIEGETGTVRDGIDKKTLHRFSAAIDARPKYAELPHAIAAAGTLTYGMYIDYGSYRDLQRHRSLTHSVPLLTMTTGFHPWYLANLSPHLQQSAATLLSDQQRQIIKHKIPPTEAQYYTPMGYLVYHQITGDLRALTYAAELRSGITVHPTLQKIARTIAKKLETYGIKLHIDPPAKDEEDAAPSDKRGTQTIIENPI